MSDRGYGLCMLASRVSRGECDEGRMHEFFMETLLLFHFSTGLAQFPISVNPCHLTFLQLPMWWWIAFLFVWGTWTALGMADHGSGLCMLAHCLGFLIRGDALIRHGTIRAISFQHHSLSIPYFLEFLFTKFFFQLPVWCWIALLSGDLDSSRNGRSSRVVCAW